MPFEEIRFRVFVTVAMRVIGLFDRFAMHRAPGRPIAGGTTPATSCTITSQGRALQARLVTPNRENPHAVLILHGIGERLDYWQEAQRMLAENDIASMVFHYSGYGGSNGAITPTNLRQDTIAAYAQFGVLLPAAKLPFVLGLSLGTGVAIDAAPHLHPPPSGIILCQPFSSFRAAAAEVCGRLGTIGAILKTLLSLVPDVYRNVASVRLSRSPLLIVHSDADELFPVAMAREIESAASDDPARLVKLVVPHGFAHNDAYLRPSLAYWRPILDFIKGSPHCD